MVHVEEKVNCVDSCCAYKRVAVQDMPIRSRPHGADPFKDEGSIATASQLFEISTFSPYKPDRYRIGAIVPEPS